MAEIIDSWTTFTIALTSSPTTPTPTGANIRNLAPGDYNLVVTKSRYGTVTATIRVSSSGRVSCSSGPCGGSNIPRVSIDGNAVRVFLRATTDTSSAGVDTPGGSPGVSTGGTPGTTAPTGAGGVCGWITALGGWKSITWPDVLAVKYAYLDPANHSVGFSNVTWDDVLGVKYYYYGIKENNQTNGNSKLNCGFA